MPAPTVTPLPTPYPNRATMDPATYVAASDARMAAEQGFGEDIQTVGEYVAARAAEMATVFDGVGIVSAGVGLINIDDGAGPRTLEVDPGLQLGAGMNVNVAVTASPDDNWLFGKVTFYDNVTGELDFTVPTAADANGSGSHTAWTVTGSGPRGFAGLLNLVPMARSSNTMLDAADTGKTVDATGTFTQTFDDPADLGDGWFLFFNNRGAGVHTLALASNETLNPGETSIITCDGVTLKSIKVVTDLGPHVIFQDQKTSGTPGGAHSGTGYVSRGFNTTERNLIGASLSSGRPVLDPGTYFISSWCAYGQQGAGDPVRAKIQNITDGTVAKLGRGHRTNIDLGGFNYVAGVVTLTAQKTLDLQQYMLNNIDTDAHGYAVSTGDVEIFAEFAATLIAR